MRNPLLLLFFVLSGLSSFAQRRTAQLGIKAGVNIANFNDDAGTTDSRVGFHGGLLVHVHIQPNLAIQPEIVYSQQGAEFGGTKQKVDYVNIPVMFQYLFSNGFRLQTGPQLGLLVSSEYKSNGVEVDNDEDFKKTDAAWAFGFGYVSASGLGVDARYNLGFSDITKGGRDVMNRVWQFGMFYQFKK
jgi:Outer membrane protein beta-barrel domain